MVPSVQPDETYQVQFGTSPPLRKFIRPSLGMKAVCVRSRGRWDVQLELPRTANARGRGRTREDTSSTFKVVSCEVEDTLQPILGGGDCRAALPQHSGDV